jgi:hypothetical protein
VSCRHGYEEDCPTCEPDHCWFCGKDIDDCVCSEYDIDPDMGDK